jgi:hypothetical protein
MMIADLKTACAACNGSGRKSGIVAAGIPQINVTGRCQNCQGRGFLLTELGQDLWKVFQPLVEDLVEARLGARSKP